MIKYLLLIGLWVSVLAQAQYSIVDSKSIGKSARHIGMINRFIQKSGEVVAASWSDELTLRVQVFSVQNNKLSLNRELSFPAVCCLMDVSNNGDRLAYVEKDNSGFGNSIRIIDLISLQEVHRFKNSSGLFKLDTRGVLLANTFDQGRWEIWSIVTGQRVAIGQESKSGTLIINSLDSTVNQIVLSDLVVGESGDPTRVIVRDFSNGSLVAQNSNKVLFVATDTNTKSLCFAQKDGSSLYVWNYGSDTQYSLGSFNSNQVTPVEFSYPWLTMYLPPGLSQTIFNVQTGVQQKIAPPRDWTYAPATFDVSRSKFVTSSRDETKAVLELWVKD